MTIAARPLPARRLPTRSLPAGRAPSAGAPALALNASLLGRRDVGSSAALFTFLLDAPIAGFHAGQYVALGLPAQGALVQRPYSVVALGHGGQHVELLIRRVERGTLSPRLWEMANGARARIGPPRGLFTLDHADPRDRLFLGAGTGIAPLLAMLGEAALEPERRRATLVHGVSHADELVFGDRVERWRMAGLDLTYRPTVSRPEEPCNLDWSGEVGRAEALLARVCDGPGFRAGSVVAYVCGNPYMVEACRDVLGSAGVPDQAVRVERF